MNKFLWIIPIAIVVAAGIFFLIHEKKTESSKQVKFADFNTQPVEVISDLISRQYIYGGKLMLCRWELKKGALIPKHMHPNEQITYITSGSVKVTTQGKEYIVSAGELLMIPPNTYHEFIALEDTIDIDVFSPPREDWIKGTDSYLRKK